jgi:hypothetical protein
LLMVVTRQLPSAQPQFLCRDSPAEEPI